MLPPISARERERMEQILNKVGSYWLGQKANKQLGSVGDDINVRFVRHSTPFTYYYYYYLLLIPRRESFHQHRISISDLECFASSFVPWLDRSRVYVDSQLICVA